MRNVVRVLKDVIAFLVTIVAGLVVGTALSMADATEAQEAEIKKKIERHRQAGP